MRPVRLAVFPLVFACVFSALPAISLAGEADVTDVRLKKDGKGTYQVSVTVRHADTGWEHYADKWDVLGPDGAILGTRVLLHPHVEEQPFTRSLGGLRIPEGVSDVTIRAHDKVHGYGGREMTVKVPR